MGFPKRRHLPSTWSGQGHAVFCAVPQASEEAIHTARKVMLLVPAHYPGDREPELEFLARRLLVASTQEKWAPPMGALLILGHAHITGGVAIEQANLLRRKYPDQTVMVAIVNHILPLDVHPLKEGEMMVEHAYEKQTELVELARRCGHAFSVGPLMFEEYENFYHALGIKHERIDPPPSQLALCFDKSLIPPAGKQVLFFGRTNRVMVSKGVDLIAKAMGSYAKMCFTMGLDIPSFVVRGALQGEGDAVRKHLLELSGFQNIKLCETFWDSC